MARVVPGERRYGPFDIGWHIVDRNLLYDSVYSSDYCGCLDSCFAIVLYSTTATADQCSLTRNLIKTVIQGPTSSAFSFLSSRVLRVS
jgi:hypothetical protein